MEDVITSLKTAVQGEVDVSSETLERYSRDASLFVVRPEAVFRPVDAADIETAVRVVSDFKRANPKSTVSLTPRSAGTDMSGGPLSTSVVVDVAAHLNRLVSLTEDRAVVEPGLFFRDFDRETKKIDRELPSYTASRELNTLGGMIGNNSGGEKNLKYGKTARYVEELDVVLADGRVHTLRALEGDALKFKLIEDGFEGDIYRGVARLLKSHREEIKHAMPQVEKNSSGYALWDIGDGEQSLNLARLMVGAQGTLGIITKATVSLVRPKPYAAMTVLFLNSLAELGPIVPEVLAHQPDSFESYDDHTFKLAVKYFPEFAAQMKTGLVGLGLAFLPEVWMALTGGVPTLVLLVEFRGDTQAEATRAAEMLRQRVEDNYPSVAVRVAKDERAARKYWVVRRESFNLLRKKVRGKRSAPFIDDFVVPPQSMPEFLPKLEAILSRYDFLYTIAGHVGDGNFHIIPLVDPSLPDTARVIDELSHKVYDLVLSYGGSISGEHNDGIIRTPYVEKMFGPPMYALFCEIKRLFDPLNIFNPGKKVGSTFSEALSKLDLPSVQSKRQTP